MKTKSIISAAEAPVGTRRLMMKKDLRRTEKACSDNEFEYILSTKFVVTAALLPTVWSRSEDVSHLFYKGKE